MFTLVIGAGLAGLTCARTLLRAGRRVLLLEASDEVGGRVRSDHVSGFTLDRGFQVLFTAYPAAQRQLHYPDLDLQAFDPGAIICLNGRRAVVTDPLRDPNPSAIVAAALTNLVTLPDKLRILALAFELRGQRIEELLSGSDHPTLDYLRSRGFSSTTINNFFRPFYGGIFLDRSLNTSAKCFKFDFKMLSEGQTVIPAAGMGAISQQLAAELRSAGCLSLGSHVAELLRDGERVVGTLLADGTKLEADHVVVATSAPEAARLSGLPMPQAHVGTVNLYFAGTRRLYQGKKLLLNAAPDAFVNNAVQISNVAPAYAPVGKHLLSVTILGVPPLDDTQLYARAMDDLKQMFAGDPQAQSILADYTPLGLYRIPYAQFAQPPGIHPGLPENQSGRPGLFFAAEFTEASSLNAAMISGEECAKAILA